MTIAERTETAVPIVETLTKLGLQTGATLEASVYDPRSGVTNRWLTDFSAGTWGTGKVTETMAEVDTGRYAAFANMSAADSASSRFYVFIEVTAGGSGGSHQEIVLVDELFSAADKVTLDAVLADTSTGGPGPWTTASGNPVIANPIIEAINNQTTVLQAACSEPGDVCGDTRILAVVYTGQKGTNLVVPVYRNNALMPDSELANGTQFSMNIRNITTDTAFNISADVNFAGTGYLSYTTRAADGIFETPGKWEYQADGLTEQGAPFESHRLTVRVYDDVDYP